MVVCLIDTICAALSFWEESQIHYRGGGGELKQVKRGRMLKKRSRGMKSTNQAQSVMPENGSFCLPKDKQFKPNTSSFFTCSPPGFFSGFAMKGFVVESSSTESAMSPTSILDNKPFSAIANPIWSDTKTKTVLPSRLSPPPPHPSVEKPHYPWEKKVEGIADVLLNDNDEHSINKLSKPDTPRMLLFGSNLKIQIPPPVQSQTPPLADFGTNTKSSPIRSSNFPFGESSNEANGPPPSGFFTPGCLSPSEMELSEDYTCVISRGPNPRTTHIFGDCIVQNCCGFRGYSAPKKKNSCGSTFPPLYQSFLSFCYYCKRKIPEGKDIFIYRGEQAFCSPECRYNELVNDKELGCKPKDLKELLGITD